MVTTWADTLTHAAIATLALLFMWALGAPKWAAGGVFVLVFELWTAADWLRAKLSSAS